MSLEKLYYAALGFFVITGVIRMFLGVRERRRPLGWTRDVPPAKPAPVKTPEPAPAIADPAPDSDRFPPLDLAQRFRRRFNHRTLEQFEYLSQLNQNSTEILIDFFQDRDPYRLIVITEGAAPPGIRDLRIDVDGQLRSIPFSAHDEPAGERTKVWIEPGTSIPTSRMVIDLDGPVPGDACHLSILGPAPRPPDLTHLDRGLFLGAKGWDEDAVESLLHYEAYTDRNPLSAAMLSRCYRRLENWDQAERYAIQSMLRRPTEAGVNAFRAAMTERPPRTLDAIRKLQAEASDWELEPHLGMVVLETERKYRIGSRGLYLSSCREVIEVRRPAMARFLRRLGFGFAAHRSWLPHTELRVIHRDGEVEQVDLENFSVSDADHKNIYIRVEDEKAGQWILPDLEAGDVIDWSYHVLTQSFNPRDPIEFFILASVFDARQPTYRAWTEFVVPRDFPVQFSTRNGHLEQTDLGVVNDVERGVVFRGERYTPVRYSGFPYENNFLNPVVACAARDRTWAEVAATARRTNLGPADIPDELPETLENLVAEAPTTEGALEAAFYWVRDTLKYASFQSASDQVGKESRARKILEAGTGDCKDKSYLLSLVCRRLGIACDHLAVSTESGILFEDLPGHQFDHVFLRARLPERFVYMDAANSMTPFGSPPAWCQGMKAMVVDDAGTIIHLPVDPPEANRLRIVETFDRVRDGWLEGTFELDALGHSARQANEGWKFMSLTLDDPQRAAQESLRSVLPRARVRDHQRLSDTGSSNRFQVAGSHWRSPLVPLGSAGDRMGLLFWSAPPIPIGSWRNLHTEKLFVLEYPVQIELEVEFRGELFRRLRDLSRVDPVTNRLVEIREEREEAGDRVRVRRSMVFRPKYVRGEALADLEPSMEALERALILMASFRES